ncbi:hypothetical protein, conserved [Trypanosoma brucei gambiense DAL972]|uniref:Uncharacterized protein n=1 Tax=Trypanosoma brucei gambiense (strain MHOM/CI/86/DAL972) TaxID=679716 RepID=D0A8B6_TRYB9|nr:hypothetical protein, conserved [Trypanosoma brucei gambiense DAL972]CBH17917.1 hypothetical protein, conserved [Trypanosoma brucei gambiense DAL972]|eukprot:XP_011780181.1 hypothetical protein, conserved [Trypanosoma brucei gambiense DAL972]
MGCQQSGVRMSPQDLSDRTPSGQHGFTGDASNTALPIVPTDSWYGKTFSETSRMAFTEFHLKQRGNIVFAGTPVPVGASELGEFPGNSPPLLTRAVIGKDNVYGMAYLYSTPLSIEHQWRLRVCHYQIACSPSGQTLGEVPGALSTLPEAPTTDEQKIRLWNFAKQVYDRPLCDTFVGIKVYVDGELVPDRYPRAKSLPNCTATLESSEVFNNWTCVPFVLVGYVNSPMISTVTMYRHLSLSFVEYMLGKTITGGETDRTKDEEVAECKEENTVGDGRSVDAPDKPKEEVTQSFNVSVEVVYGCEAEMNFCTAHIAKGNIELVMGEHSDAALRKYKASLEEFLRKSGNERHQVVAVDPLTLKGRNSALWTCLFCGSPLQFTCTICGAELCGMSSCVWKPFTGYPLGCSSHKAQA